MVKLNCPKCSFSDDSESEVRLHSLYTHQFFLPQCSTQIAKQSFIDYDKIRSNYHDLRKKIDRNESNLRQVPYKWEGVVSKIRHNVKYGYGWNDNAVFMHVRELPEYLRKDIVVRIKKDIQLRNTMRNIKDYIKKEGIVI